MSQQIDNQIVKMQFDNASFEKNVKESMSTLDRLKKALHFDKVDMTPLQQAFSDAENTASKAGFHIRDVWLKVSNIIENEVAQKIVNAGKKIFNALTMEGITDGFREYELKMGSIQTIMAGTGESLATVNKYLDELNTYSDQTIYSFSDMTNSIGKFTNAGVNLKDAVNAIKGIANEAAISGANSNEASRAMYNFAQALSAGYVKLIDWKSIENANMATKEFKSTLLEVASAYGTTEKKADGMYEILTTNAQGKVMTDLVSGTKNFNDSLQQQWMTTDVLTKALAIYATDVTKLSDAEREQYELELKKAGFDEAQIKRFEELGTKATAAASEIKTFSMLMDTLKEAIGSGWATTWQLLIGDFEQAKALWTDVGDVLGGAIDKISKSRNDLLEKGLATGWERFVNKEGLAIPQSEKFKEVLLDLAKAQGALTEKQYNSIETTGDMIESMHTLGWVTGDLLTEATNDYLGILKSMSAEDLSDMGITEADIKRMEQLSRVMKTNSNYANSFADSMTKLGGRENIIKGLSNMFHSLLGVLKPIKEAFDKVFTPLNPRKLADITRGFEEFTEKLIVSEDAANTLRTSFTLAFGAIKAAFTGVTTIVRGFAKLVLPVLNLFDAIFGLAGKIISALTGSKGVLGAADKFSSIGDKISKVYLKAMQKLAKWINKVADAIRNLPESPVFIKIHDGVVAATEALKGYWEQFVNLPIIQEMVEDFWNTVDKINKAITPIFEKIGDALESMRKKVDAAFSFDNLNKILTVIYSKLKSFASLIKDFAKRVKNFFEDLRGGKSVVESFRDNFDNIIKTVTDLKNSITEFFDALFSKGEEMGDKFNLAEIQEAIHNFVTNITPDQVTMLAVATTFGLIALNMLRLSEALRNAVEAFTGVGVALKNVINSYMKKQKSTILQIAEAIVIVAASLWVLSKIPKAELDAAVGALMSIVGLLGTLTIVLTLFGSLYQSVSGGKSMVELATSLVLVSGAIMVAALSLKVLEKVNLKGILPKVLTLAGLMIGISFLTATILEVTKENATYKAAVSMVGVAAALLLVAESLSKLGTIPDGKLESCIDSMLKIMLGMSAIIYAAGHVGVFSAVGLIMVVLTLDKIMPLIEKIVSYDYTKMEAGINKNIEILKKFGVLVLGMVAIGAVAGNRLKGAAVGILAMATTFGLLLGVAKLASMMNAVDLKKGESFLWHMAGIIALLELCSKNATLGKFGGKDNGEGSKAFTRIAITMGILLGITKLASMMDGRAIVKGELAVAGLIGLVALMMKAAADCKNADHIVKATAGMIFAISFVLGEVALLSMIPLGNMLPAFGVISGIMVAIGFLAKQIAKMSVTADENAKINWAGMGAMLAALGMVIAAGVYMSILSDKPVGNVAAAAGGIAAVIASITFLAERLSKIEKFNASAIGNAVVAIIMVALIAAIIGGMAEVITSENLDTNGLLKAAASISLVMLALIPTLGALEKFTNTNNNYAGLVSTVLGAIALIGTVAFAIGGLSKWGDSSSLIQSAVAISTALVAICVPMAVLGAVGKYVTTINPASYWQVIGGAIALLAGVTGAVLLLSNFGNPDTMLQSVAALSAMLFAICVPMAVIAGVGNFAKDANVPAMAASVIGAVGALFGICAVLIWFGNSIDLNAVNLLNQSIPILTVAMAGVSVMALAIAEAGKIGDGASGGFGAMIESIVVLGAIIAAISGLGAALNKWEVLDKGLEKGLDALVVIAEKIGTAIGAFVGGLAGGLSFGMVVFGANLMLFGTQLEAFHRSISGIESGAFGIITELAGAITLLTGAEILKGIADLLGFGLGLDESTFGAIGLAIVGFCDSVSGIDEGIIGKAEVAAKVANCLADMSSNIQAKGGLAQLIFGEKDLGDFATDISAFGAAIVAFCASVQEGIPENAAELTQRAADAAGPMIDLTGALVAQDGWLQAIIGEKNLGEFGKNLSSFADGMKQFVSKLVALEKTTPNYKEYVAKCAESVEPMITVANSIRTNGGVISWFTGKRQTLSEFGENLFEFIKNYYKFVLLGKKMADAAPNFVNLTRSISVAVTPLVEMANKLTGDAGLVSILSRDMNLEDFGNNLEKFGESLSKYSESLADVNIEDIGSANTHIKALVEIGNLVKGIGKDDFNGLIAGMNKLSELPVSTVAKEVTTNAGTLTTAYDDLFKSLKTKTEEHTKNDKSTYTTYGKTVDASIKAGIVNNKSEVTTGLGKLISAIKSYLTTAMSSKNFETYGKNLVLGFKKGIEDNAGLAVDATKNMTKDTAAVIPKGLKERSPSRLTYGFGKFLSLGFANGITDYASNAIDASTTMTEDIVANANTIISSLARVIDSDIDTQPTIRPVLDTTNIEKGAGKLNRIFRSSDLSLAYSASGSINQMNNAKYASQEGANVNSNAQNGVQISYVQNNYSPKALSRIDIYRETKNQISMMKGAVSNA